jgi:ubiquinone biosynthesis protein UbiJ
MTEETSQASVKVSDMIRITAENQNTFLIQIADHIDKLEQAIDELRTRVSTMEQANEPDHTAQ